MKYLSAYYRSFRSTLTNKSVQLTTLSFSLGGSSHDPTRSMDHTACTTVVQALYLEFE